MASPVNTTESDSERFFAQTYLLRKLFDGGIEPKGLGETLYRNNYYIQALAENYKSVNTKFLGKTVSSFKIEEFLENIKPFQLSFLVPKVKFYKVFVINGKTIEQELLFDSHLTKTDINNMMKNKTGRGGGVGLKNFNWKYVGVNPAESKSLLEAELTLYASRIEDFTNGSINGFSFLDLILPKGVDLTISHSDQNNAQNQYRIRADVGWSVPKDKMGIFKGDKDIIKAIEKSSTTLYLSMKRHKLDFKEDGTVVLNIEYFASIDGLLSIEDGDIFSNLEVEMERANVKKKGKAVSGAREAVRCARKAYFKEKKKS